MNGVNGIILSLSEATLVATLFKDIQNTIETCNSLANLFDFLQRTYPSIDSGKFRRDWQTCLEEHYEHAVERNLHVDPLTESQISTMTLSRILQNCLKKQDLEDNLENVISSNDCQIILKSIWTSEIFSQISQKNIENARALQEFMKCLAGCPIPLGIIVNSLHVNGLLSHIQMIRSKFATSVVLCSPSSVTDYWKPDCRIYEECLLKLGRSSKDVVVICESLIPDVLGALWSNLPCVQIKSFQDNCVSGLSGQEEQCLLSLLTGAYANFDQFMESEVVLRAKSPCLVGYYLNPKKQHSFAKNKTLIFNHRRDVQFVNLSDKLLLNSHLDKIHALIMKPTHLILGHHIDDDPTRQNMFEQLSKACVLQRFPIFDSLANISCVVDRERMLVKFQEFCANLNPDQVLVRFPNSRIGVMDEIDFSSLKFPLICKPLCASGPKSSHIMSIIPTPSCLSQLKFSVQGERHLYQEFINHDSFIFKVYVMGSFMQFVETRSSFPDMFSNPLSKIFEFNSHTLSCGVLSGCNDSSGFQEARALLTPQFVSEASNLIRDVFKLSLFGFDLVVDPISQEIFLIDINHFPSYKSIPDLGEALLQYVLQEIGSSRYVFCPRGPRG